MSPLRPSPCGFAPSGLRAARRRDTSAPRCPRTQRGLTLIELAIAIAIAAVLFAAVVTGVGAITGAKAKEAAGELAGTIRAMYDEAALTGRTCRIAFELPAENDQDGSVSYTPQCAKGAVALGNRDEEIRAGNEGRREDQRSRSSRGRAERNFRLTDDPTLEDVFASEKARVETEAQFSGFEPLDVGRAEISSAVRMSVWVRGQREPVRSGVAYLYFHPQGYADRARVFVQQGNNAWTIDVSPLTGKAEVIPGLEEVPDR
ncbi:MAG TPA: prepilin-type N-terminal cleavage/methylation domain-containing protein [Myxococcaceae bacterium]|nr:prepilin-type N-terminal cleavage/methylation domain-containing protein [Myxococcaceae bacterium]